MFCWNRKPLRVKVISTVLYYSGIAYRVVAGALRGLSEFSYESVRLWFRRLKEAWTRNMLHAEAFLRKVLEASRNKPLILVDKGPWYPEDLRSLGLKWRHAIFGMRNRIERWFSILKARTKRFYNNFPNNSTIQSIKTFPEAFTTWYNTLLDTKT